MTRLVYFFISLYFAKVATFIIVKKDYYCQKKLIIVKLLIILFSKLYRSVTTVWLHYLIFQNCWSDNELISDALIWNPTRRHTSYGLLNWLIDLVGRDRGSIPGRVIPNTLKMVLHISLLDTQQYKVRIKGKVEQSREKSSSLPYT